MKELTETAENGSGTDRLMQEAFPAHPHPEESKRLRGCPTHQKKKADIALLTVNCPFDGA
ncbi:MAG: hypothetical protein ACOCZ8_02285 [Bacteroidota bacterium]